MESRVNETDVVGLVQDMLLDTQDVQDFLDELARFSAESISGPRGRIYCGVTLLRHRSAATVASSNDHAQAVDEIQYQFGDGPCLRSCREGVLVHVRDLDAQNRCGQEDAINLIKSASSPRNLKLRDIAAAIVESAGGGTVTTHFD